MDVKRFPLLAGLHDPLVLHQWPKERLEGLASEARDFLIETIHRTGGHLGAALGVVELTVALFNQFDFLKDRIVWDVGHQAHVYKMLTGRANRFSEYGEWEGLCKFLDRQESPFDHMGAGHASTSVSSAMGMALARERLGQQHHVLAVIGDGAMTGGLAYEALNLAGSLDLRLLVILNDNGMSIDENVGAMARTVTRITSSDAYNTLRDEVKRFTQHVPFGTEILKSLKHMERSVKDYASEDAAAFFESLGFHYFGPIPAHDLESIINMLKHAKSMHGPILLHLHSVKGKGLGPDLENTFAAHAVSPTPTGKSGKGDGAPRKSWTAIYSEGLQELMAKDPTIMAITAAMQSNTGLSPLAEAFPGRVLDVGIAESNAYCSAAGMAIGGLKPFVTIYSTFSQRAFDQMIHDIALQRLPVRIMMDRGGLVGSDGPTHNGVFDFSYLRMIPGFVHMAPRDELEMRRMLLTAHAYDEGPIAMRYPRGDTLAMSLENPLIPTPVGKGEVLQRAPRSGLLLIAAGSMVSTALQVADTLAAESIPATVVDARFIKPLDEELLASEAEAARGVMVLEENTRIGGLGEGVLALLAERELSRPAALFGIPDEFIGFGSQKDQLKACGLLPEQVAERAREFWKRVTAHKRNQRSA